jgi:tetratricopeptide (TPR) repeat protein
LIIILLGVVPGDGFGQDSASNDPYHTFMFNVIDEINRGQYDTFFGAIRYDIIIERALSEISPATEGYDDFRSGLEIGAKQNFETSYRFLFDNSNYTEYINYYQSDNLYTILLRVDSEGINYFEFELLFENDRVYIIDIFPFITGSYVSETLGQTAQIYLQKNNLLEDLLTNASDKKKAFTENLPKLNVIRDHVMKGEYETAREVFNGLPKSVQNHKLFLVTMTSVASELSYDFYLEIIDRYEKYYPDDRSMPLVTIDAYLLRGDYEKAIESIDKLDDAIGGDTFLDVMRGNVYAMSSDTVQAKKFFYSAISRNEYREEAYWRLIEIALDEENFTEVSKTLTALNTLFGYEFEKEEFNAAPYIEFYNSDHFDIWYAEYQEEANN